MWFPSHHPSLWTNNNIVIVIIMITWGWPNTLLPWSPRTWPRPRHQQPWQHLIDVAELELKLQRREVSFSAPTAFNPFIFIMLFPSPCDACCPFSQGIKISDILISGGGREEARLCIERGETWCTCPQAHSTAFLLLHTGGGEKPNSTNLSVLVFVIHE